jgi:hypothetical protein
MVAFSREPKNPFDQNAVAVSTLSGDQLGHVPRELAGAFSEALGVCDTRFRVCCQARAYGRRVSGDWNIGIWLAIPDADQLATILIEAAASRRGAPGDLLAKRDF